jgi:hypothetical protein
VTAGIGASESACESAPRQGEARTLFRAGQKIFVAWPNMHSQSTDLPQDFHNGEAKIRFA